MDPVDDLSNYRLGVFYYNKNDSRIIVPKRLRYLGWAFNFATWQGCVGLVLLVIVPVISVMLLNKFYASHP